MLSWVWLWGGLPREEEIDRLELPDARAAGCLPLAMKFLQLQAEHRAVVPLKKQVGKCNIEREACQRI
jgi:hypothetical protein